MVVIGAWSRYSGDSSMPSTKVQLTKLGAIPYSSRAPVADGSSVRWPIIRECSIVPCDFLGCLTERDGYKLGPLGLVYRHTTNNVDLADSLSAS